MKNEIYANSAVFGDQKEALIPEVDRALHRLLDAVQRLTESKDCAVRKFEPVCLPCSPDIEGTKACTPDDLHSRVVGDLVALERRINGVTHELNSLTERAEI